MVSAPRLLQGLREPAAGQLGDRTRGSIGCQPRRRVSVVETLTLSGGGRKGQQEQHCELHPVVYDLEDLK